MKCGFIVGAVFAIGCWCAIARADSPADISYWLNRATAEAGNLTDPAEKAGVLTAVAQRWLGVNQKDAAKAAAEGALPLAQKIEDADVQFQAFLNLVSVLDQAGDADGAQSALAGAQAAADALPAGPGRQMAAAQLAAARARIVGFAAARRPIDEIADPASKVNAFCQLAEEFFRADKSDEAAQALQAAIAAMPSDPLELASTQPVIVRTQADIGDLPAAEATAAKIADPITQADAYGTLAEAYARQGKKDAAQAAIDRILTAAGSIPDENKPPIFLRIARVRQSIGDTDGASKAIDLAVSTADHLSPLDRTYALAASARQRADLGDKAAASLLADDAAMAAKLITDAAEIPDALMTVAAAQGRCGSGTAALQTVAAAEDAAKRIPPDQAHPQGDPSQGSYMDVVLALSAVADYPDAETIALKISEPHLRHEAILRLASAEVDASEFKAAEDTAHQEGTPDMEASVCGMIAGKLARTRSVDDAAKWTDRLPSDSDRIAAQLAVAAYLEEKPATRP